MLKQLKSSSLVCLSNDQPWQSLCAKGHGLWRAMWSKELPHAHHERSGMSAARHNASSLCGNGFLELSLATRVSLPACCEGILVTGDGSYQQNSVPSTCCKISEMTHAGGAAGMRLSMTSKTEVQALLRLRPASYAASCDILRHSKVLEP